MNNWRRLLLGCKVDEDEPLFLSLISDLFPGISLDVATYADLQKAISSQVGTAKLINHPPWNLKVIQVCAFYRLIVAFYTAVTTCNKQLATDLYHNCSKTCREMGGATSVICLSSGTRSVCEC